MPLKALLNGVRVFAADVAGTAVYTCDECGAAMHYRKATRRFDGVTIIAHFAHNPMPAGQARACASTDQSPEHLIAKETIRLFAPDHFAWLANADANTEVAVVDTDQDIDRRADVLFTLPTGQRVIFEAQFTRISRRAIAERTRDYYRAGHYVVWCFPEKRDDLYRFCKDHFYCVVRLSNDGTEMDRWGNIAPRRYAPSQTLRHPFDPEVLPPLSLPVYEAVIDRPDWPTVARAFPSVTPSRRMEELPRTAFHTLVRREPNPNDPWDTVPHHMWAIVRNYIGSNMEVDLPRALELCVEYDLDYHVMRRVIDTEMNTYEQARLKASMEADNSAQQKIA